jgi:hypothetical protein
MLKRQLNLHRILGRGFFTLTKMQSND